MELHVALTEGPIERWPLPGVEVGAGAWTEFRGLVRGEEEGRPIVALEYEAYAGMAERVMRRALEELARVYPCVAAVVIHRVGRVPVGEAAIYVGLATRHRAEGFGLLGAFMDRLKQEAPIWKCRAVWREEVQP